MLYLNKMKVLFLCTHNSARSQIAEGLLRHFYGEQYEVFSAGSTPTRVNPFAVQVMNEIGINISTQRSKSIKEFQNTNIDLVVAVCRSNAKVVCPFCSIPIGSNRPKIIDETLPEATQYLYCPFRDPSDVEGSDEEKLAAFRHTRDKIKEWILDYFVNLKKENLE